MTELVILGLLFVLVAMGAVKRHSDAQQLRQRIDRIKHHHYHGHKAGGQPAATSYSLRRRKVETRGLAYWLLKPFPDSKRMADMLERAGSSKTPKQFIFACALRVLFVLIITLIAGKPLLVGLAIGLVLGVWIPFKLLRRRIAKQAQAFLVVFPEAIDLIVRGLRSGLPVSESVIQVAKELPDPLASVFATISNTMKLGVPMEKALMEMAKKLDLREFYFFTTSIILQRETGGNLAEILNNLSEVLRSRFIMKMKIKALTSEARASTMIIGALPFVVVLAVSFASPAYMAPLLEDSRGNISLAVAACMMGFGLWIMNRMAQFEI
jgi:tight adherence protein B